MICALKQKLGVARSNSRASVVWCVQGYTAFQERSGSVVECFTRDQRAAVSSLKGVSAVCP